MTAANHGVMLTPAEAATVLRMLRRAGCVDADEVEAVTALALTVATLRLQRQETR